MRQLQGLVLAALSLVGISLAGCGFTPMYANNDLARSLRGVAVETPPHSRTGYLIRQAIDDELGRERGEAPRYRVLLNLQESRGPRGVRVNNVAGRYEIDLVTTYRLLDAQSGEPLVGGSFVTQVSYDSADAPYAGLAASQEGEERAAQQAAVRLRLELSRYIAGHPYHAAATPAGAQQRYRAKAGPQPLSSNPDSANEPRDDLAAESPTADGQAKTPAAPRDPI